MTLHRSYKLRRASRKYLGTLKACPKCGNEDTYEEQLGFWGGLITKPKYYCEKCGNEQEAHWLLTETASF